MSLLNITAYFIIPLCTIAFYWDPKWLTFKQKNLFLLWGMIVGTYYFFVLRRIIQSIPRNKKESIISKSALVLLAMAITTPYLIDSQPLSTIIHVGFSFMASIFLLICQYMIIWKLYCMKHQTYRSYLIYLNVITVLSALLLYLTGIRSPFLSILFTLSCTILLQKLYCKINLCRAKLR